MSRKGKKDKNRSLLSTITSAGHFTTKPPTELQPPSHGPPLPEISIPDSPAVSSSIGGSGLTTKENTPITTRSLKPSFSSSLSYVTDNPEPPPPQPPTMSRQNSDTGSVIAGGLGSALGGVLTNVWGSYKSANASPVVENPPPGPATAAFESTLETIEDVEFPGGFNAEREWEAPHSLQGDIPEPVIVPPSPQKLEELEILKAPTPKVGITDFPAPEPETVPQTPIDPESSVLSVADRKKAKKQREKERKDREAQEAKERAERERVEQEEREARERKEREDREGKKRQDKAEREARKKKEREDWERQEQEARAERERIDREAYEQAERERERVEREAKEQADREARQRRREAKEREEREVKEAKARAEQEAKERAEQEAKEQAEKLARDKMDKAARRRADKEAKEKAEREAKEKAEREEQERLEEVARLKAERAAKRKADREAKEQADREAKEKAEQEARERAEQVAVEKARREAKAKADREEERLKREEKARLGRERELAETERVERERVEREEKRVEREEKRRIEREEKERMEREANEKAEKEAKERAELEAKQREEEAKRQREEEKRQALASKTQSPWGSAGKNDRSRKTSAISQKEQRNEWANTWERGPAEKEQRNEWANTREHGPAEKEGPSGLPKIFTSSASGLFDGVGDFLSTRKNDSPGGAEEVELRTPVMKKGKKSTGSPSNLSKVATPTEPADVGKHETLEELNMNNMSGRRSVSSRSENERWTDAEQGESPTNPALPAALPDLGLGAFVDTTMGLLGTPKGVKDAALATPKSWPAPSLTPARQSPVPTSPIPPAKAESEKPLSLWERKKLNANPPPPAPAPAPAPASSLLSVGDGANSSGVFGDTSGGGGNGESIPMPAIVGDRQSVFTDTARGRERENQRENVVEGLLGSSSARRRNESTQSQSPVKPAPKPTLPPPPPAQKSGGWGSWGSSLLTNIASTITAERSPSPEPAPVKPKIEDPPRGFTPSQPPKSQQAGFGTVNKLAWGAGGTGANNTWGGVKTDPTPVARQTSPGPAWGANPVGGGFGSGGTAWGSGPGSTFGPGVNKNLSVDTTTKPAESSPNTAWPENIPESAVEIKHVPAPGRFGSVITDKEETGDALGDSWGLEEGAGKEPKKTSKPPSPTKEKEPEPQAEAAAEEPAKAEEVATPAEEDEFDWANTSKKKKSQANSMANTPSAPNTPDPDNGGGGTGGGGGGGGGSAGRKKKNKRGRS